MAKITIPSPFLKPHDFKNGDKLTIVSEAEFKHSESLDKDVLECKVKIPTGEEKIMSFNNTSIKWLVENLGEESKGWVGKQIPVFKLKQNVRGTVRDIVYVGAGDATEEEIPVIDDTEEVAQY